MDSLDTPSGRLKQIRNRLGITIREVERLSRRIAEELHNKEFYVSNGRLIQIESNRSTPSIYKLFSLSVIYRIKFDNLLMLFGVDLDESAHFETSLPLPSTHLMQFERQHEGEKMAFPVRFNPEFSLQKTSLISRMVEVWAEVPIAMIHMLDPQKCLVGYIGMSDRTMYPLLRPGSFVQIEREFQKRPQGSWQSEFDRPIYFIELQNAYACAWCEMSNSRLTLIPHPLSGCATCRFLYPSEARIVGQVSVVTMRLMTREQGRQLEVPEEVARTVSNETPAKEVET